MELTSCLIDGVKQLIRAGHEEHKQIWTPDTIIYEAIESDFQIPGGVQPNVYSDGSVFQSNIIENRLNCPMKPRTFPFDQQECEFTFGCWSTHLCGNQPVCRVHPTILH